MQPVNQQLIKDNNLKSIYNCIHDNKGISRSRVAELTHLSKTTVSTLVDELIDRKFIMDAGCTASGSVGRRPNSLYPALGSYYTIIINLVENQVHGYLIDITGAIVYDKLLLLDYQDSYIQAATSCVYDYILKKYDANQILGICFVVSAMIDEAHRDIYSTTLSLPASDGTKLMDQLCNGFPGHPVALLEDTACYAYAEKVYSHIEEKNFAFVNFGRGIGATLFIEGRMLGNASGAVTQFGHYSTNYNGSLCVCGNHGCLETTISEYCLQESFQSLGHAAAFGNKKAVTQLNSIASELSRALANMVCIVHPSLIILGGKCQELGPLFLKEVQKSLKSTGFQRMTQEVAVQYSALNADSFLRGAMKYFFDRHFSFTENIASAFIIG